MGFLTPWKACGQIPPSAGPLRSSGNRTPKHELDSVIYVVCKCKGSTQDSQVRTPQAVHLHLRPMGHSFGDCSVCISPMKWKEAIFVNLERLSLNKGRVLLQHHLSGTHNVVLKSLSRQFNNRHHLHLYSTQMEPLEHNSPLGKGVCVRESLELPTSHLELKSLLDMR